MTTTNLNHQYTIGPARYHVPGSKGAVWAVTRFADGVMHCTCPDHEYRRRECKHMIAVRAGEAGKPIIRVTPKPARTVQFSAAARDLQTAWDV